MPRSDIASPGLRETLVASAARTTNNDSGAITGFGSAQTLRIQLNTTAIVGTLDVVVEDSLDSGATWNAVATFVQVTAVNRQVLNVTTPFSDRLRVRWTIGGATPSSTFAVDCYSE